MARRLRDDNSRACVDYIGERAGGRRHDDIGGVIAT